MSTLHYIGKISCEHNYATPSRGIELVPTKETQEFCQRENLWLNIEGNRVSVYAVDFTTSLVDAKLTFWLKVTDSQFYNYIQLNSLISEPNHLLFFSNEEEQEDLIQSKAQIKNVQRTTQVVVFDEVVEEDDEINVYHRNGHLVYQTTVSEGAKSSLLDLSYEDDGIYTWTFGGYSGNFFLTDKSLINIIGVCAFQIKSENEHRVTLQFETKKTYWEYLIISKEKISNQAYDIIDQNEEYTFTYQGKVSLVDVEALSYISDQEIPYKAYPTTLFKLVPNEEHQQPFKKIEDRVLPNASPQNIRIHNTAERTVFKTQTILYI